jgi:hypothetical protein
MANVEVIDVTSELIGERREEYREGFDAGLRQGTTRFLQSDAMHQIAFELKLLRVLYAGTCEALAAAQHQIGVLEAELDYRAPGWDA